MTSEDAGWRSGRYLALAKTYHQAAAAITDSPDLEDLRSPFFALLGQAAELALKAVVARSGCDDERLLVMGHDLVRCWQLAQAQADFAKEAASIAPLIELLAGPHQAQAFRYPTLLSWPLPSPREALWAVGQLLAPPADGPSRA